MADLDKYIGIKFEHAGRSLAGIDCIGLISMFLADQGYYFPAEDGSPIPYDWHKADEKRLYNQVRKYCKPVKEQEVKPNDLILMNIYKKIRHIGVVVDGYGRFLHIREGHKSSIERMSRWNRLIHSYWRPRYKLEDRQEVN